MRRSRILLTALVTLALCGCGDDAAPADATTTTGEATTTTAPATTTPPGTTAEPADDGSEALAFFRASEVACVEHAETFGNQAPEPGRFADATVAEALAPGSWRIVDGSGQDLVVDLENEIVHSTDGPDGVLPIEYSFGCPPELFVGTLDH